MQSAVKHLAIFQLRSVSRKNLVQGRAKKGGEEVPSTKNKSKTPTDQPLGAPTPRQGVKTHRSRILEPKVNFLSPFLCHLVIVFDFLCTDTISTRSRGGPISKVPALNTVRSSGMWRKMNRRREKGNNKEMAHRQQTERVYAHRSKSSRMWKRSRHLYLGDCEFFQIHTFVKTNAGIEVLFYVRFVELVQVPLCERFFLSSLCTQCVFVRAFRRER